MKNAFYAVAIAGITMVAASCSNTTSVVEEVVPAGMVAVDLSGHGFPLKINVPDSVAQMTMGKMELSEGGAWGGASVVLGKTFQLNINSADAEAADMAQQKVLLAATDAGECTFSTDNDSTLVYVVKFGEEIKRHHFYMIKKIGAEKYVVRDLPDPDAEYSEADIQKMMEAAKSLRAKPAAPKAE
jgi:hypothetical protein